MSKSNIERIDDYLNFGSPMNQIFAIEALTKWAETTVANAHQLREEMKHSLIHPEAWIRCAEDWLATAKREPIRRACLGA